MPVARRKRRKQPGRKEGSGRCTTTYFAHTDALDDGHLVEYVAELGLDMMWFLRDLSGHAHRAQVRKDIEGGVRSGVSSTPTFFINDVPYDGVWNQDDLFRAVSLARGAAMQQIELNDN